MGGDTVKDKPKQGTPEDRPATLPAASPAEEGIVLTPEELKRRNARNVAIGIALGALVILFYVVTVAKLGVNVLNRPL